MSFRSQLEKVPFFKRIYQQTLLAYYLYKNDMVALSTMLKAEQLSQIVQYYLDKNDMAVLSTMLKYEKLRQVVDYYFALYTIAPTLDTKSLLISNPEFIDVKKLIQNLSPDELKHKAEEYFSSMTDTNYILGKPFTSLQECPELLNNFACIVQSASFIPGQVVLEFGAGSCWVGRLFNQLGLEVVSLDISATALAIGKKLKETWPVFGDQPNHTFLEFDGYSINLPDASVDRVVCFDSFHHVGNPERVLQEFYRVLKPNGLVAFSEPGPYHSFGAQSQEEMKKYTVIENDIVIEELWPLAQKIGFNNFHYALISSFEQLLDFENYKQLKNNGLSLELLIRNKQNLQNYNFNATKFFISKGTLENSDSRLRDGLISDISILSVKMASEIDNRSQLLVNLEIKNISNKVWLKSGDRLGSVSLGAQLFTHDGEMIDLNYFRYPFLEQDCSPGDSLNFECFVPCPLNLDTFILQFDLVSHKVIWFASNGSVSKKIHWPPLY